MANRTENDIYFGEVNVGDVITMDLGGQIVVLRVRDGDCCENSTFDCKALSDGIVKGYECHEYAPEHNLSFLKDQLLTVGEEFSLARGV